MHLNFSNCLLGDNDAVLMVSGIKISRTLISLHLSGNDISQFTMLRIMKMLEGKSYTPYIANSAISVQYPLKYASVEDHEMLTPREKYEFSIRRCGHKSPNLKIRDSSGDPRVQHRDEMVNIFRPSTNYDN